VKTGFITSPVRQERHSRWRRKNSRPRPSAPLQFVEQLLEPPPSDLLTLGAADPADAVVLLVRRTRPVGLHEVLPFGRLAFGHGMRCQPHELALWLALPGQVLTSGVGTAP